MDDWVHGLQWNGIAYAVVATTALLALLGMWLFVPALRKRWLPLPRLRPGRWTGYEFFLAYFTVTGFSLLIPMLLFEVGFFVPLLGLEPDSEAPKQDKVAYSVRCSIISSPLVLAFVLGLLLAMMYARSGSRPHHYGLSWSRWPANLALGITAFVLAWPVIIGIHLLLFHLLQPKPDPLLLLGKQNLPWWEWLLFGFQTTLCAPLLEEIVFRGILQGWLRRATIVGHVGLWLLIFFTVARDDLILYDTQTETVSYNWDKTIPLAITVLAAGGYLSVLFRLSRTFHLSEAEIQRWQPQPSELPRAVPGLSDDQTAERRRQIRSGDEQRMRRWAEANANLAIFGSALLFAVAHPWPNAIALFAMGLVLGWLSRRTQSLIGPITFHALFNLTAFITFYGAVLTAPEQNGNAQTTAARPSVAGSIATSVPTSQLPRRK